MRERSASLDLLRGLAALFVMMGHLRSILFVPFDQLENKGIINSAFWFATGFGHECVMVFFVLSGFFVGAAWDRRFSASTLNSHVRNYAINRIVRLWVVLLPALFFTALIDWFGIMLTKDPSVYSSSNYYAFIHPSNDRSIATFIANIFFLQTIVTPTFGTNSPLWSLANEFWYYAMFPALYLLFVNTRVSKIIIAMPLVALLYFFIMKDIKFVEGLLIWLMGFWAYRVKAKPGLFLSLTAICVFLMILAIARLGALSMYTDLTLGVATAFLIIAIRHRSIGPITEVGKFLSKISYTLYLVHLPLIIFLSATVLFGSHFKGGVTGIAIFITLCLAIIAFAYGIYYLFERRTDDIRKRLKNFTVHRV